MKKKRQFIRVLFKNKEILAVIDLKITISKINNQMHLTETES